VQFNAQCVQLVIEFVIDYVLEVKVPKGIIGSKTEVTGRTIKVQNE